ncbi:MAG TPA: DNA double-strand break repair nuclease NurA [Candidatus Norongarragalinales archaeon]|nr:DNA double-strand break repair nuclease NurA [Candidatus Norongarragalinales archaeon]
MINESAIKSAVQQIQRSESEQQRIAKKLRDGGQETAFREAHERKLTFDVEDVEVNGKIAAVDGGLLAEELHSIDIVLTRAAAVVFEYEKSKLKKHHYHPSSFPDYEVHAPSALEAHEAIWFRNIARLDKEITAAIETIEKYSPFALFLDGSIVPQVSDKPAKESEVYALYEGLIGKYNKLFSITEKSNCLLLGIIKDSRGKQFLNLAERHMGLDPADCAVLKKTNDSSFLFNLLNEKERTFAFRYASISEHPILRDLRGHGDMISSFYLKAVKYDRPLRIDFLHPENGVNRIDEIASLAYSLSKHNQQYAYPAILIEADLRAALDPKELEIVYDRIFSSVGMSPSIFKLRRNTRPFR